MKSHPLIASFLGLSESLIKLLVKPNSAADDGGGNNLDPITLRKLRGLFEESDSGGGGGGGDDEDDAEDIELPEYALNPYVYAKEPDDVQTLEDNDWMSLDEQKQTKVLEITHRLLLW